MDQPRCPYCGKWFKTEAGKGKRQVTCLKPGCQSANKKILDQRWHRANPEPTLERQGKVRAWAAGRDYWCGWRDGSLAYVERNRAQTRERMRKRRAERRQARMILSDPASYLRGLRADVCKTRTGGPLRPTVKEATAEDVCKTRIGGEVLVGVVDYLLAREVFAKHEDIDGAGAAAG